MNRREFLDVAAAGIIASTASRSAWAQSPNPQQAPLTRTIAAFVARLRYQDIPAKVVAMSRTAIMDTLGVSVVGGTEESARVMGRLALEERAKQESTVYGQRFKSSALQAALVNGTAAHAHDFDHSFVRGGQPTAPVIPAIFSLGEAQDSSGQQILEAYVAGVEVIARLIFSVTGAGGAGWHANNTIGVFGASAACAKLLGLKEPEIEMALAIAASTGSGLTANFGTMTKPLHVGLAARNGVLAARLAQSEFTANPQVLEAKNGFFDSYYQTGKPDLRVFDDLATRYALEEYGVRFKPYPCGGLTHTAIYTTIRLRQEHNISPASVDHVDVAVPADTAEPLVYREPRTGLEGKFSMPYLIARALVDGNLTLDTFTDEAVRNEDVRQLLQRVDMRVDAALQAGTNGSRPAAVSIRLKNGQTLTAREEFPKGSVQLPMTSDELVAKFRACARGVISDTSIDRALRYINTLETMRSIRPLAALLGSLVLILLTGACATQDATNTQETTAPAAAAAPAGDWPTYGGPLAGDRYSPLTQISPANVGQLQQVCAFDAPEAVNFQSGIVAMNGVIYFTLFNNTYAVDGATCQQKWKHTRPEPNTFLMVNRGVAYSDGRLFRGTGDAHVVAIDATNGQQLWDVAIGDPKSGESAPLAPIAWSGLVFAGNAGGDNFGVRGRIYALDATSGREVWRFDTVPDAGPARATWVKASAANPPSGGATWTSYSLDETNGVLYVPTGNAAPDFAHALRPGDNLYTNSLLALDAKTGRLLSYVQPLKNDFHDWDLAAPPALITTKGGHSFVAQGSKDGHVYNIDRGDVTTKATGEPGQMLVRSTAQVTTRENADVPLSTEHETRFCPGVQGGVEWNGPAYHPGLGLLYVNAIDWCTLVKMQPTASVKGKPGESWTGAEPADGWLFGRHDPTEQWKGWVTAFDPESGDVKWKVQTPKPMVAAITATAGGVVFTGDLDGNVLAYDASSGKELWRHATGKAIGGGVISYQAGGKQRIAVATGMNAGTWNIKAGPARVVVYALP